MTGLHGAGTDDIYDRAGFGARVTPGSRPVVLVVDLTRGFTEPGFPTGADLTETVLATARLVEVAHARGVPVVWTAIAYSPAELSSAAVPWLRKAPGMARLLEGSPGVDLDPRLEPGALDPLLVKKGASAFAGTPLATMLTAWRADTLVVCGATTSGCVRATVVDAADAGYTVLVPAECTGDRADGPHRAALFDLDAKYAQVVSQAEAIGYLDGVHGTLDGIAHGPGGVR